MYMNAELDVVTNNAFVITEGAIVNFENKTYVFIDNGKGNYEMKEIKIGLTENGFTEITNSETLNNKPIVTKGAYSLLMSLKNTADE